jgi:5'-nucleotidase
MKLLVSNDDGIYARGLWALAKGLTEIGEVVVVAPDREQSGVGPSLTLRHPLRVHRVEPSGTQVETYSVEGTPADSVILALRTLVKDEVGLLVSGINEGTNLGNDVLISGTLGAALQGYLNGIPTLAVSVAALKDGHLKAAVKLTVLLARRIITGALPGEIFLNINLPNLPLEEIQGLEVTRLAGMSYADLVEEGHDGKGDYYWIVRKKSEWNVDEGTDIWALENHRISITPLGSPLTTSTALPTLEDLCPAIFDDLRRSAK